MFKVECELIDSLMRPVEQAPVLSVVIPTFHRPRELTEAVVSIARQVDAGLAGKVEIIVTDNGVGSETLVALKGLAETYSFVNYMIHARNMGGPLQICSAPFRARGRWTWVFGDDDLIADGALAQIVELLEREQPAFITLDREVWNTALDTQLSPKKHDLPDTRFNRFLDMLLLFGFDQLSFLTSQIYDSELARSVDPAPYLAATHCRYVQLAYYIEAFHDKPAYYVSRPSVRHRWDPGAREVHAANFLDLATALPEMVEFAADKAALGFGLFERIGGRRNLSGPAIRQITFVDNVLENLWRCVAFDTPIEERYWGMLDVQSRQWRPDHVEQLDTVRKVYAGVGNAVHHYQKLIEEHRQLSESNLRTPQATDMLSQIVAAAKSLEGDINDTRKVAHDMSRQFS